AGSLGATPGGEGPYPGSEPVEGGPLDRTHPCTSAAGATTLGDNGITVRPTCALRAPRTTSGQPDQRRGCASPVDGAPGGQEAGPVAARVAADERGEARGGRESRAAGEALDGVELAGGESGVRHLLHDVLGPRPWPWPVRVNRLMTRWNS
ncbi:hypothetical protein ACWGIU_38410, partial [Streptomyces sp. NPDC054840]